MTSTNQAPQRPALENKYKTQCPCNLLNWGNYYLKALLMILCLKSIRFLTKHRLCTSTDHQSQVSTLLLNKSKRVDLVVLKQLWKSNTLNTFLEITIGKKPQMSPEKVPTFKLGQNFCQNFSTPITRANLPNWGKIFVKIFRPHNKGIPSKLGQNFCQNSCHLKFQLEHCKLGQIFVKIFAISKSN